VTGDYGDNVGMFAFAMLGIVGVLALVCYALAAFVRWTWARIRREPQDEPIVYRFATEAQRDAFINGRWP